MSSNRSSFRPSAHDPSSRPAADLPLVVFGPRSLEYDFGPSHPLSPRRFGPGIDLLRAVGAGDGPWLEPEPATDEELGRLHSAGYIATVRRFSADPDAALEQPEAGIGPGDDPPFAGMHEASAGVAGGSIRAMEAILQGDARHAYQPGGGLHHAMRSKASGFCVYNDVALAIDRARREGLRVLYVDLDVHHGDGVQALFYADPNVLTVSFHESGRWLFPGTGFVGELGEDAAAATSVNVPLEPGSGPEMWLRAVRSVVPPLAASFGPDVVVSQHGADGHFWDPLAHLALTTTAMGQAARLVDAVAHRYAGGRWFATGGGGYSVYRVVPRAWALTWLAAAHREIPEAGALPEAWRSRWEADAVRFHDAPLPERFEDDSDMGPGASARLIFGRSAGGLSGGRPDETNEATIELVRAVAVPALLRAAERLGWWRFEGSSMDSEAPGATPPAHAPAAAEPAIRLLTASELEGLRPVPRAIAVADPDEGVALLRAALPDGATLAGAVAGEWLVGVALAAPAARPEVDRLVALSVAPEWRGRGVATALLRALIEESDRKGRGLAALHTAAERDPVEPLPRAVRRGVAERLLRAAGFDLHEAPARLAAVDRDAFVAVHLPPAASGALVEAVRSQAETLAEG
jgi:acetoin utilization protein AcuC